MKSVNKLLIATILSTLSITAVIGQSGNTIRFVLTTGNDDFQSGSSLFCTITLTNGSRLPETRITNIGVRLADNSTTTIPVNIGQVVELTAIRSITLRFEGLRHFPGGSDSWNLDAIQIALIDQNGAPFNIYDSRNDPRRLRFTGSLYLATFNRQVPQPLRPSASACSATRLTVVPRGGNCSRRTTVIFPDRPLSTPASDCGQQYFPQNRTDVWYFFDVPAWGRVAIDFDLITTAIIYTGSGCDAARASGGCREDAGGNPSETFIAFNSTSDRPSRVWLRVFGSVGSRRTLCVYER